MFISFLPTYNRIYLCSEHFQWTECANKTFKFQFACHWNIGIIFPAFSSTYSLLFQHFLKFISLFYFSYFISYKKRKLHPALWVTSSLWAHYAILLQGKAFKWNLGIGIFLIKNSWVLLLHKITFLLNFNWKHQEIKCRMEKSKMSRSFLHMERCAIIKLWHCNDICNGNFLLVSKEDFEKDQFYLIVSWRFSK